MRFFMLWSAVALIMGSARAQGLPPTAPHPLDIPTAPLSESLNTLAQQSHLQILFASALVQALQGPAVKGSLTAEEALRRLLAASELQFEFVNPHTVTITARRRPATQTAYHAMAAEPAANAVVAADPPGEDRGPRLEEIVVTATKRTENLQNVPMTVSVVSQALLQSQNLADTADLKRLVPDLQFTHGFSAGDDHFGIRGITTQVVGQGLEQSVGVAFDGVPLGRNVGSIADLVDVHSVEALKGPQGTLFGKNASAGLINVFTNLPQLDVTEEMLRASFGSMNLRQYSATVNLPVTEQSALRVSAWKFRHDGPVEEVNTGQDMGDKNSEGARLRYRWRPAEEWDLNFTGEWTDHHENGTGSTIRDFVPANFTAGNAGAQIESWELSHGTVPSDHNLTARGLALPYYDDGRTAAYTGQADYALAGGTLTALISYRNIYSDDQYDTYPSDSPTNQRFKNEDTVKYDQTSEEVRYASPAAERLRYVVGLFNFRLKLREDQGIGLKVANSPLIINDNFDKHVENENYAEFGEATFDVTSQWHVVAGLRHSVDRLSASMARTFLSPPPPLLAGSTGPGDPYGVFAAATATEYQDWSWRTGLQYQLTPDVMLYATASRGYKGPGVGYSLTSTARTLASANEGLVKPEIAHGYELGVKSPWLDRRLTVNASLYDEIFDNFQTSLVIPGPIVIIAIENARQAKTTGLDLDANWVVTPELSLLANLTYDDARYTDFKNATCNVNQSAAQGCVNSRQNLDGHPLATTPKVTTNLTARYERPVSTAWRAYFQANHSYRSGVTFSTTDDPYARQGGYGLVNLSAGLNSADARWSISLYGNNVLDKAYVDNIAYLASGAFYINDISYQDLRNYGIALSAHF